LFGGFFDERLHFHNSEADKSIIKKIFLDAFLKYNYADAFLRSAGSNTPTIEEGTKKFYDYLKFAREGLDLYIKGFFDVNKGTEAYTYGERIFNLDGINQEEIMVEKLKRYPLIIGKLV